MTKLLATLFAAAISMASVSAFAAHHEKKEMKDGAKKEMMDKDKKDAKADMKQADKDGKKDGMKKEEKKY